MGYDRQYTREEIHQMLYLSERRKRPSAPAAHAHVGHPISRHTEQREDPFDRRNIKQDSTFSSRKDLVLAVEEALHDTQGQQELAKLNALAVNTCKIAIQLVATAGKIKADVVRNPFTATGNQPAQGPQHYLTRVPVNSVVVIVDKLHAPEAWAPLHIQTAYPNQLTI
jgi:hypothetical protein